ncbi:hypothetical protein COV05_02755 [Candidatus Uhrbacteria bacterium CG10_big_fil_rev_8_21_14_0_10_48_16]|uniref:Uncharacterized protein n=1 Tax=Candidatus Uhrbacteria bacterium CG10_big_fil_rev_8_21_14_0_10_48_16 TaxID=1975038 RepID=A0A2M8LH74_9BACT|nr:MAG: hypothetical protein COV05_02755 [Candidatus Uhrbacteria bacterium CG10_big_fil_rev_8_21_14_0_10_48_16]
MSNPSREDYVKTQLRFAEAWASAEWEIEYGQPQRARETARAWVGIIELMVMGSSKSYTHACNTPYQPPRTAVLPAAPEISLSEMALSVTYLPAGAPFRFYQDHVEEIEKFLEGFIVADVPGEQCTRQTVFPEDRVLISWHTQCPPLFDDGKYPVLFNVFLLSPDGKEHETSRVTTRIVAAFPSEEGATVWVKTRVAELQASHDYNHAQQCLNKTCARRGHTYEPRYDED